MEDRGQCCVLCDKLGFGLLDQLGLVDLEEIETEQRQRKHAGQNDKNDEAETWPPFPAGIGRGVRPRPASHRPDLKPTPWTAAVPDSQPAAAILARMLLTWLAVGRAPPCLFPVN